MDFDDLFYINRWFDLTRCGGGLCSVYERRAQQVPSTPSDAGVHHGGTECPPLPLPRRSRPLPSKLHEDARGDKDQPQRRNRHVGPLLWRDWPVVPHHCLLAADAG